MRIDILTLFPDMFKGFLTESIIERAQKKGLAEVIIHNIRDYSADKHKKADDTPFGGGAGMVLSAQPIVDCIEELKQERDYQEVIFLTPDAQIFSQQTANMLSLNQNLILICGRYKGIDQRVRDNWVTMEISIGKFVLTGGELAAAVISDAIIRLIPGVLGDESSALTDSYQGDLLDAPVYTKPANFRGYEVPKVLLEGNHAHIEKWRFEQSLLKMKKLGLKTEE